MKYTRVKAAACALTASVMLFGSAMQTSATGVSYELPAAGVGLVLEEATSLTSVQAEVERNEKVAAMIQEAQLSVQVTSADIESGLTGVGESAIDVEVAAYFEPESEPEPKPAEEEKTEPVQLVQSELSAEQTIEAKDTDQDSLGETEAFVEETPDENVSREIVAPVELKKPQDSAQEESLTDGEADFDEADPEEMDAVGKDDSSENSEETEAETENKLEEVDTKETDTDKTDIEDTDAAENADETESTEESVETVAETDADAQAAPENAVLSDDAEQPAGAETAEATVSGNSTAETGTNVQSEPTAAQQSAIQPESAAAQDTAAVQAAESAAAAETVSAYTGQDVVSYAVQFVGNPYVYGGTSLTNGTDCSGFVMKVYENFGISLPHSSRADRNVGTDVGGIENAQPGDIVCYSGHVGIYVGNGQIVHASTEKTGIIISEADYRTPVAVRRIFE